MLRSFANINWLGRERLDLSSLTAGGQALGAVNGSDGSVEMRISEDVMFTGSYDAGTATVLVEAGATVSAEDVVLDGATLVAAGNVSIEIKTSASDHLSTVAVTGAAFANVSADSTFIGDFNEFEVPVDENTTLTATAARVHDLIISSDATSADTSFSNTGGSVVLTGLSTDEIDLSNITAGGATTLGDTAGTLTVEASGNLNDATAFGDFKVNITNGDSRNNNVTLTLTEAQVDGRIIEDDQPGDGATDNGSLVIEGLADDTDLTGISIAGDVTIILDDASTVHISANANIVVIDGKAYNPENLSDSAKTQLKNIQLCDQQIRQRKREWAVADTACIGYSNAPKGELKRAKA